MPKKMTSTGLRKQVTRTRAGALAGVATVGAAALALTVVPQAGGDDKPATEVAAAPAAVASTTGRSQIADVHKGVEGQAVEAAAQAKAAEAKRKAEEERKAKAAAAKKAAKERAAEQAASRAAERTPVYPDNLDGWIRESLAIMSEKGIPGSYEGIHRNIMRESGGNPRAINNWDINAINGVPSKGLLQVIAPTFQAYHVEGTSWDAFDPVANITAACNYAADRYGSMDNVDSAY